MPQSPSAQTSGHIDYTVIPQKDGRFVCDATLSQGAKTSAAKRFEGQTAKHAIAMTLEGLASAFRKEAEAEQNVDWDAVERTSSGNVKKKHFHVILHFEHVIEDDSKFEAMVSTQMGNTVVEQAEISIFQVDPDLQIGI